MQALSAIKQIRRQRQVGETDCLCFARAGGSAGSRGRARSEGTGREQQNLHARRGVASRRGRNGAAIYEHITICLGYTYIYIFQCKKY
eukprot:2059547-Pleurochrysis_carterae.AAC.4